eukprot:scpid110494/ scgid20378/ 
MSVSSVSAMPNVARSDFTVYWQYNRGLNGFFYSGRSFENKLIPCNLYQTLEYSYTTATAWDDPTSSTEASLSPSQCVASCLGARPSDIQRPCNITMITVSFLLLVCVCV